MRRALLGTLALLAAACAGAPTRGPDAPFVVTPHELGAAMLRLASVTARDVVYDLGSGDGRIVIAAARLYGARGVGVEIDPRLVRLSQDRALNNGVGDRVTILWQDIFATDISAATVVTLYLGEDVNMRLRPKLLKLRPGTRVVSNTFGMGDWTPDRVERVRLRDGERTLYFWVVPADAAGVWRVTLGNGATADAATLTLAQRFQRLTGTLERNGRADPVADGALAGDGITFVAGRLTFRGRLTEDGAAGTATAPDAAPLDWTARRAR